MSNPNTIMRDETIPEAKGQYASSPADIREMAERIAKDFGFNEAVLAGAICSALVMERAAENERCAKICENEKAGYLSPEYASNQPFGSITERFACDECAKAIRSSHE